MLQNFSQTQGTVFHSSACISSSEGFFKNRSAHFCGKSPSSGACPSQIAILFSLGLKFLMKWKPTYIYGDLNFSDSQQAFANLFSWRKLEGSLIISWKFQGRTPQEIWITAIFPARSKVVSYDVLHHTTLSIASCVGCDFPCDVFFPSEGKTTSKKDRLSVPLFFFLTSFEFTNRLREKKRAEVNQTALSVEENLLRASGRPRGGGRRQLPVFFPGLFHKLLARDRAGGPFLACSLHS